MSKTAVISTPDFQILSYGFRELFRISFEDQNGRYYVARVQADNKEHAINRILRKFPLASVRKITKESIDGRNLGVAHRIGRGLLWVHNKLGEMEI